MEPIEIIRVVDWGLIEFDVVSLFSAKTNVMTFGCSSFKFHSSATTKLHNGLN